MDNVFVNTIDYDFDPKHFRDMESFYTMLLKIQRLPCCFDVSIRDSNYKGMHVTIACKISGCSMCRMVFDDQCRFEKDSHRPDYAQNVLFTKKGLPLSMDLNNIKVPIIRLPNSNTVSPTLNSEKTLHICPYRDSNAYKFLPMFCNPDTCGRWCYDSCR